MDPMGPLPQDFGDIQNDPKELDHARNLVLGVEQYNSNAGRMVRYLGEFITLKCAPDMLMMKLFPNAKEISESFGAFEAVRRHLQDILPLGDPNTVMVAVGDGGTPRTAATFAFRTNWQCHSVDPVLKGGKLRWNNIKRLSVHDIRVEDFEPVKADTAVVVCVHSHAKLNRSILAVNAKRIVVVAIPCCVDQKLSIPPDKVYEDKSIISPKREVRIWRNVAGCAEFTQPNLFTENYKW